MLNSKLFGIWKQERAWAWVAPIGLQDGERECQVVIGRIALRIELKQMGYGGKRPRYRLKETRSGAVRASLRRIR